MGAGLFRRHGVGEHFFLAHALFEDNGGNDPRPALGNGAGLVQQHGVGAAHLLDERAALDEHALLHRRVDGRGEGRCRGQLDAAGVVDDQHLQRLLGVLRHQPHRQAEQEVQRHQIVGEFVRVALDGRFFQFAGLHHAHDAGNDGLVADLGGLHVNVAALDHRAGEYFVAFPLLHGHKFARNGALVYHCRAVDDFAVYRDLFARVNRHRVAEANLVHGLALQLAVRHDLPRVALVGGEHLFDGGTGTLDGVGGHQFRQIGQRQDHQRRVSVAQQQTGHDGRDRQEIRVGAQIPAQPFPRAFRHGGGQPQTGKGFQ